MINEDQKNQIIVDQVMRSSQLKEKFFFHWAILATGTVSLLIPLVQSLDNIIIAPCLFKLASFLLVFSVITSSIRNFIDAKMLKLIAEQNSVKLSIESNNKDEVLKKKLEKVNCQHNRWKTLNFYVEIFAIGSYIMGVVLILWFINKNIL